MFTYVYPLCILSLVPPFSPPLTLSQKHGSTALIKAACFGNPRIVEILIKADPSRDHLNSQHNDGNTALAVAIYYDGEGTAGCAECVALLQAAGAV